MTNVEARGLAKAFGSVWAVRDLSFTAPAGQVTGFLGPNGSGKTTTLRMLLGLVRPSAGTALIGGRAYRELPWPRRVVGAMVEAEGVHPGRRGRDHLRVLAGGAGVPDRRVDEVLEQVDLTAAADRRVREYSLGMRQRLGLAGALLGDPEVLILDEPANGLDPAGISWLRGLLRAQAAEGRSVIVSSHLLSEVAQTVDHVVIITKGQARYDGPIGALGGGVVTVVADEVGRLAEVLRQRGYEAAPGGDGELAVRGATGPEIGRAAASAGIALSSLSESGSLEAEFLRLTGDDAAPDTSTTGSAPARVDA
ncbi:MAG: ATP-binding cassette domain-containing protein [Streptomycetaceae bacterium]|nr:ATP-binding cassette domain-containing protein [Streptomycetaceae bacterium]